MIVGMTTPIQPPVTRTFRLPPTLAAAADDYAETQDRSFSWVVRSALEELLARNIVESFNGAAFEAALWKRWQKILELPFTNRLAADEALLAPRLCVEGGFVRELATDEPAPMMPVGCHLVVDDGDSAEAVVDVAGRELDTAVTRAVIALVSEAFGRRWSVGMVTATDGGLTVDSVGGTVMVQGLVSLVLTAATPRT